MSCGSMTHAVDDREERRPAREVVACCGLLDDEDLERAFDLPKVGVEVEGQLRGSRRRRLGQLLDDAIAEFGGVHDVQNPF